MQTNFVINFSCLFSEYRTNLEFTPLRDSDAVEDHQITVCVRKRPMNKKGMKIYKYRNLFYHYQI